MSVHFSADRMDEVYEAHRRWWRGELDRPLARITLTDAYPAKETSIPVLSQENCTDFRFSPEEIIDALDNELSRQEYLGDAYPIVNLASFGPGVLAAFCGARLDNSSGRVWFFPQEERNWQTSTSATTPRIATSNASRTSTKQGFRSGMVRSS